jgi:membrane protein YqaA with SNARE-associated domain
VAARLTPDPGERPTVSFSDLPALGTVALWTATFLIALVSGLIPFVLNIELYLLAVATLTKASPVAIVALTTAGQMLAKFILYQVGRGALNVKWIRRGTMSKAADAFVKHPASSMTVVAVSALTGFPPFYGVSLMAGTLRLPLVSFLTVGTVCRVIRFGAVYWAPSLFHFSR